MFLALLVAVHACAPAEAGTISGKNMGDYCVAFDSATMVLVYTPTGNGVNVCLRTKNRAGWISLGPGESMGPNAKVAIGYENRASRMVSLTSSNIGGTIGDFAQVESTNSEGSGRLSLCMTVSNRELHGVAGGDITTATFVVGFGNMNGNTEQRHATENRKVTSLNGQVHIPWAILMHVILLMFAYLLFYPVSVLIALYASPGFQGGKKFFEMHRWSAYVAVALTVVGVIVVFIFTGVRSIISPSTSMASLHGIFGILIVLMSLAQPINAYFRVGKDDPKRARWNFIHKFFGRSSTLLGLANSLFGGFLFQKAYLSGFIFPIDPFTVAIVMVVITVFVYFALHYDAMRLIRKKKKKEERRSQRLQTARLQAAAAEAASPNKRRSPMPIHHDPESPKPRADAALASSALSSPGSRRAQPSSPSNRRYEPPPRTYSPRPRNMSPQAPLSAAVE